jgi:hypothetical protein
MNNAELYSQQLLDYIKLPIVIIIFVAVVTTTLIAVCLKIKYRKMAMITLIGGIVISAALYFTSIFPFQLDVQKEAYITYSGEFYVEDCYSVNGGGTYILIQYGEENESVRYKVLCDVTEIENETVYNGAFVYSQHSQCLVDIELQAN